ncbi:hypothetical protein ACFSW8_00020 [Rubritalea tangerina]|uniref:Uncharacterized protein n=1 Tax=Rubritalea tangerina TaxID=430798 RepID=A0ABW4Z647_9BACT
MRIHSQRKLKAINPTCDYYPNGSTIEEWQSLRKEIEDFTSELNKRFSNGFKLSSPGCIQDATYGAEIYLPTNLIIGSDAITPCIRVSNHGKLYIVTVSRRITEVSFPTDFGQGVSKLLVG